MFVPTVYANSGMAMKQDGPVLAVELDVEEMAKNNKA
jgi:hypothetical protein